MRIKILVIVVGIIGLAVGELKYHQSKHGLALTSKMEGKMGLVSTFQFVQGAKSSAPLASGNELAEIRSPFYLTEFSIILISCLIVTFVSITYFSRIRDRARKILEIKDVRVEERYILRKEIARDFHDEMGNHLARIINYVGLARVEGQPIDETLSRIEQSAKDLIEETKDFVWALDPENESVFDLFLHVKDFGEKLFRDSQIEFSTRYEIASAEKLPLLQIRHINLILKELLTNVLKHSKSDSVELTFASTDHSIDISVIDNGIGIETSKVNWHDGGLSNTSYRAKKIDAHLLIQRRPEGGTMAELKVENLMS